MKVRTTCRVLSLSWIWLVSVVVPFLGFLFSNTFVWFFCRKLSWNWMFLMKNLSKKLWVLCLAYQVFNFLLLSILYPLCFVWLLRKQRNWKYIIPVFCSNKFCMCWFIERTRTLHDLKYKINPMISVNGLSFSVLFFSKSIEICSSSFSFYMETKRNPLIFFSRNQ